MTTKHRLLLPMLLLGGLPVSHAASVNYQFTGGSMTPTVTGLPEGVTASNFSLGALTFANLSDNGGSGNSLRISQNDLAGNSTATALTTTNLTFSLTIPVGVTLNLTSLTYDFTSGGLAGAEYINARLFSSIDGTDDLAGDTIGVIGRITNGADSGTGVSISLATPDSNATNGANSNNGDFSSLTNTTVTFSMPFIRTAATTTDYVDIDNITLNFVPEPSSALMGGLGLLALLRRRR